MSTTVKSAVKERPILFSGPMVKAILNGTKSQTRRIVKPQPQIFAEHPPETYWWFNAARGIGKHFEGRIAESIMRRRLPEFSPYGVPGERLWVRETWMPDGADCREALMKAGTIRPDVLYRAEPMHERRVGKMFKWRPSIHMPRWASRINLEITDVRVERLNQISNADALAEGVESCIADAETFSCRAAGMLLYRDYSAPSFNRGFESPVESYRTLWESINGPGSWEKNPWCWVIEFKRIESENQS